ncbi:MAG: NifU family protein [Bacteroidetes bacterium]|nr:NifU family protein [Bacteroidota bacterium]
MIEKRIEQCLNSIRPYLNADGGDVLFRRLRDDGVLELEWVGTCRTCPMSQLTLRAGVERAILHEIPEVHRVEAVT